MKNESKGLGWFPGHMNYTRNLIKSCASSVDLIINLVDARAPLASANFSMLKLVENKPVFFVLNKSDLADSVMTKNWIRYFKEQLGFFALSFSCKNKNYVKKTMDLICSQFNLVKKLKFSSKMIRLMIVGIPNVGKSTLINTIVGSKKTKVENRPGVTKFKQWIFLQNGMSLLDMPGVLPLNSKTEEEDFFLKLIGSVKRSQVDLEQLALNFLHFLNKFHTKIFECHFSNIFKTADSAFNWLEELAVFKKMFLKHNEPDLERVSNFLINEFQNGKFGRLTLEKVPDY